MSEDKQNRLHMEPTEMNEANNNGVSLTRREKEVLALVAKGLTTLEIAAEMFVTAATVETHRSNTLQKLNAKNSVVAVAKAIRLGLIE